MTPRPSRRALALLVLRAALLAGGGGALDAAEPFEAHKLVHEGIEVEVAVELLDSAAGGVLREADDALFRFTISDTTTSEPLRGLHPAAWMALLQEDEVNDPEQCKEKVEEFVGGSILSQAELDLNVYYVLALNRGPTITVVDPLFGFGGTKLLAMIRLPSPGDDWALTADRQTLFVSLPASHQVAIADTGDWKVKGLIDLAPGPADMALQPDGAYLWVGLEAAGAGAAGAGVAVVDTRSQQVLARFPTGQGLHEIAVSPDNRQVFVTNRDAGTVSVIGVRELRKLADVETGSRPVSVAYSPLSETAYVTHEGDGTIVAIDARKLEVVARMQAEPGLGQIRFAPGGRLGFAVNPRVDTVSIVDAALNRIVQVGDMKAGPDQVTFTEELAYIRHRDSEIVLMIPLREVGEEGRVMSVVDFPGGQEPLGKGMPSRAPAIVRAPGAIAVLVANPADRMIYYYKEGMAAPMGSFKNYDREPRAVMVVDRSLRETSRPGIYETSVRLRRPGRYQIAFFLETPRIVHCFDAEVAPNAELERQRRAALPVQVEPLVESTQVATGETVRLRFRLTHPLTGNPQPGLGDVQVMAYTSGNWHRRQRAKEIGEGVYEAEFVFSEPGAYRIAVECRSQRLRYHQSPQVTLRAVATPTAMGSK